MALISSALACSVLPEGKAAITDGGNDILPLWHVFSKAHTCKVSAHWEKYFLWITFNTCRDLKICL
jgi:hypothetical protein